MRVSSLFVIMLVIFSACSSSVTKEEYLVWFSETGNPLRVKHDLDGGAFEIQYKTAEAMNLACKGCPRIYSDNLEFYQIRWKDTLHEKDIEFLHYLSYQMENDLIMDYNGKEETVALYHFERSYDMGNQRSILVAFAKPKQKCDRVLMFDASRLGAGPVRFVFSSDNISKIPTLKNS